MSDGRTIELDNGKAVRLAAILPPTAYDSPAAPTNWPLETSTIRALERLTAAGTLALAPEREAPDRYGRLIAQAFLVPPDGQGQTPPAGSPASAPPTAAQWLQARLVSQGHARVALTPEISTQCAEALLAAEADAEENRLGLWREALYQPKTADDPRALLAYRSTFQIVIGTVHAVTSSRGQATYLNFAEDWQRDFTARIRRDALKLAGIPAKALDRLTGRTVRIRGWIERRGGPLITVWRLEQIELLAKDPATAVVRQTPPRLANSLSEEAGVASPDPTDPLEQQKAPTPK